MEHFYSKIQGWCTYFDLYKYLLDQLPEDFVFAEIGVWKGQSLSYFVVESININKKGTIYAVDHWKGSEEHLDPNNPCFEPLLQNGPDRLYNTFLENIESIKKYITILRHPSVEAATYVTNESLDAIFIDGGHTYNDVISDLVAWYPKVKRKGILCGHDFDWPEVKLAVNNFFTLFKKSPISIGTGNCWMCNKN